MIAKIKNAANSASPTNSLRSVKANIMPAEQEDDFDVTPLASKKRKSSADSFRKRKEKNKVSAQ